MQQQSTSELGQIRRKNRIVFWGVAVFSLLVNTLMLTGPLYMMNVYDRVLGSGSVETLVSLTLIVAYLYLCMTVLDFVRGRLMARVGARFQSDLDERVFSASMRAKTLNIAPKEAATALKDLEAIQRCFVAPGTMSLFDLPYMPVFFFGIFLFHPWLGMLAVIGAVILIFLTLLNQAATSSPLMDANVASYKSEAMSTTIQESADTIQSLGMRGAVFRHWQSLRNAALAANIRAADRNGGFSAATRGFRLFLQSAMLGLGAYLVLERQLTGGAMIAGSILMGRALAPVEQLIGTWPLLQRARAGWLHLNTLLKSVPASDPKTELPRPRAIFDAQSVTVVPPGEALASLKSVSFKIEPGRAIGVIGPSGAGKSTVAKAVTGLWRPAGGSLRLDGAALDQYDPDTLGQYIGYLPQAVRLLPGTIRQNIARFRPDEPDDAVINAARKAGAHEMILKLPNGYDTEVTTDGGRLSGGQVQRIGLARAMFGDPVLLVLDEPNSNLDNEGSQALNAAIRAAKAAGSSVLIMAHRPAAIQECDMLLVLDNGTRRAFGPRDEVLKSLVKNHSAIQQAHPQQGGVS